MESGFDPRIVELLCSHLCHELISPVSAVNNGMELISGGDAELAAEAMGLIRQSAAEASRRLQFYRLAYGQASGFESGRSLVQARELAQGLFQGSKITLGWTEQETGGIAADKQSVKLLLNAVGLAREALPRGGRIAVTVAGPGPVLRAEVAAEGPGARLTPELQAAMAPDTDVQTLTPRTVHAYLVAWLARRLDAGLAADLAAADRVVFRVQLKTGG